MTVQTFIVNYNYTFQFIHDNYGKDEVVKLWQKLNKEFCVKLYSYVQKDGLKGMHDFFYADDGISSREHVQGEHGYSDDYYYETILNCPSVNEMVKRKKKRYRYYCEHCYWLYAPCLKPGGFVYDIDYGLQEDDKISDCCSIKAYRSSYLKEITL